MVLPSRRRHPDYYQAIHDPIDLTTIRGNIQHGHYTDIQHFDDDFVKLFRNVEVGIYCIYFVFLSCFFFYDVFPVYIYFNI